ncbi:zinc finger protein RFP-like [Protobothrops mucrosquamatus]|uniref:zinc finger protein RFP-like n=1 Tax=Protobothrops mucrosquamatus TaxID=103944 RepID=UPI000775C328|nr:zinc finger protein RFP-like [Protobothrops mucrosquamatus]
MDVGKMSEYLPDAAKCTLCMDVFHDPVTLNCGHNYCQACLQKHWGGAHSNVVCPQCHQSFDTVTLVPNRQLGNVSWLIKKLQDKGVLKKLNQAICETHKEPLMLFCQTDRAFLCSKCQESQGHRDHALASLDEAAHKAKDQRQQLVFFFQTEVHVFLKLLRVQKAHVQDSFAEVQTERENLVKIMELDNQRFGSGYKEMYEVVKMAHLDQMMAAKWINEQIEEELARLARKHYQVRTFTKELERKFEEPAYEFLKDIKGVMARCKELLAQPPEGQSPPFKEKMWDLALRSLFVDNTLKRCRANVTMDRLTAHPHLLLSASKKIVTHDATPSGLLPGRRAFDTTPCILAEEGFAAGRHCWQVEVTSSGHGWAFGVMKDSVARKGPVRISADDGIWALLPEHLPPAECPPGTSCFRLYLDYEGGTVHFFKGATREPLLLLSYAVFLGERIFPFFKLEEPNSQMRIVP